MKILLPCLYLLLTSATSVAADEVETLFVRRVAPLVREKCLACHGQDPSQIKGDFDLRTRTSMMKGGESGKSAIVAGDPNASPLYLAVLRNHDSWQPMPPKDSDRLNAQQIEWIHSWILGNAVWPSDARIKEIEAENSVNWSGEDGTTITTSGGISPDWTNRRYKPEDVWAWQPVQKTSPPDTEVHPVDSFISARLPQGLTPAPAADRVTLIRRASFDLTGLPPDPEEVDAFVRDPASTSTAFLRVIDRLLASPHYGERMAQHWLDVTRYADSSGFANDYERGSAWRYRDYVVRAFNTDKSYQQFIREQIAGDEIDPGSSEMLIAAGFLRMGPWELTGMEVAKVARQRFLDDVTNSVGETFLAQSLQCARCHDHKFDPIPTRDYYSIQAVFATTQLVERPAPFLPEENVSGFDEKKYLEMRRVEHLNTLSRLDDQLLAAGKAWFVDKAVDPHLWNTALEQIAGLRVNKEQSSSLRREFQDNFGAVRGRLMKLGVPEDQFPPKYVGFTAADYGNERIARKGLERLRWEFDRYEPIAMSVYSGKTPKVSSITAPVRMPNGPLSEGELEQTCILSGGDPFAPGEKVQPGVLSALSELQIQPVPESVEGRRLAFADWVANRDNPLTTRAIVNRIWLWHFGQPIAGNPNNFGSTGGKPTHPELLDWLAVRFIDQGWSFKSMHRLIMTSETYQRSSLHPSSDMLQDYDPAGTSYAVFRPRRLTGEELRDAMLVATGELNRQSGGVPNRPEINSETALQPRQVMGTFASAWVPNPLPAHRHRRTLYSLKIRGLPDPTLEVFNAPSPDFSCERREISTVTPQVFSLFNSQSVHSRALSLANRVMQESKSDEQAVTRCFALLYARGPSPDELQACLSHWRETEVLIRNERPTSSPPPLKVRRDAVEENTGEKFSFDETLHSNADFVPDLQRADVSVHTRALADVCLALFNSSEFAYIR